MLPARVEGDDRYRKPPLTVECWAKLFSKTSFNVLVSTDPKSSGQHWEIYTYAGKGDFSAYLPGTLQGEIRSGVDVCDGKWHHLAMTHDGKTVRLFVDGKNVKEQAVAYRPEAKPQAGPAADRRGLRRRPAHRLRRADRRRAHLERRPAARGSPRRRPDARRAARSACGTWTATRGFRPTPTGRRRRRTVGRRAVGAGDGQGLDRRPVPKTDTGPYLNATIDYEGPKGKVRSYKATAIKVGDKGEATVLFDRNQLRFAAAWTGGFLNHSRPPVRPAQHADAERARWCSRTSSLAGWADEKGNFESTLPADGPAAEGVGEVQGAVPERRIGPC